MGKKNKIKDETKVKSSKKKKSVELKYYEVDPHPLETYEPKPINWKKVAIVITILLTVGAAAFCIYWFALRGDNYVNYRNKANDLYRTTLSNPNKAGLDNFEFINDELKTNTALLIDEVNDIYTNKNGYAINNGAEVSNFRFKDPDKLDDTLEKDSIQISGSDWMYGYWNQHIFEVCTDLISKGQDIVYNNAPSRLFGHKVGIRVTDDKISAIGFERFEKSITTQNYYATWAWVDGSNSKGIQ